MNFLDRQQSHLYNFECGLWHCYPPIKIVLLLFKILLLFCIIKY